MPKLYDVYTGKPAPEGAPQSKQYIRLIAYVRRHVKGLRITKMTYVNAETGKPAPGITKETRQRGQHITVYSWRVRQKYAEFSKILKAGGDLPSVPSRNSQQQQNAQAAVMRKAGLPPACSKRVPPKKNTGISRALFDSNTGKRAPEGAFKSEQYITFDAYVRRHVEQTKTSITTYVNVKTGGTALGVTKESHKRGRHTTLYSWRVSQKYAEFSKILKKGGDLPPAPAKSRTTRRKAQVAVKRKAGLLSPTRSNFVPPIAQASSVSADPHSPLTASRHAYVKTIKAGIPLSLPTGLIGADLASDHSFLNQRTSSTALDKTPSAASSVGAPILPLTSHPLPTSLLDTSLSSNPASAFGASALRISYPATSSTDQASSLLASGLEKFLDDILSDQSPSTAEIGAGVIASPTESGLTAQAGAATVERRPLLLENPPEKQAETNFDLYFSDRVPSPAFSLLPQTPFEAYSTEARGTVTSPCLDPAISAEQDFFEQEPSQKRKPNLHAFFKPKENNRVGSVSKKAKTLPSDGSTGHPLAATGSSDLTSEVSFIPSPPVKMPAF